MKCQSCETMLNDHESTRKDTHGNYVDLCNSCYHEIRHYVRLINNFDTNIIEHSVIENET
jgi:NAD-dependent SIR2 family protein deacetylase